MAKRAAMQDDSSIGTSERWTIYEREKKRLARRNAMQEDISIAGSSNSSSGDGSDSTNSEISALSGSVDSSFPASQNNGILDGSRSYSGISIAAPHCNNTDGDSNTTPEEKALNCARVQKHRQVQYAANNVQEGVTTDDFPQLLKQLEKDPDFFSEIHKKTSTKHCYCII